MQIVVGVGIIRDGQVLAARRTGGGWEFPGGKVEPGESLEHAAVREIAEELGCKVAVVAWLDPVVEIAPGLQLRVARADLVDGEPLPNGRDHDQIRWLSAAALAEVAWLPADVAFVAELTAKGVLGPD